MQPLSHTLNEQLAWDRARPSSGESSEWEAYAAATDSTGHSPLGDLRGSLADLADPEDTAPRGSTTERIVGGVLSVIVGGVFFTLVGIALWGWLA